MIAARRKIQEVKVKVKWKQDYATGVEQIDQDHRMIFQMSEDFRAALDEGLGEKVYSVMLANLGRYVRGHFGFEERCMTEHRCPVAQINKAEHKKFMHTLSGFQQHYATHGYDREDAWRLVDTVDQWLDSHICHIDVHLKRCVRK
jgi:hemerythrin